MRARAIPKSAVETGDLASLCLGKKLQLRHSLGFGGEDVTRREIHDVAELRGTWNPNESAAFRRALEAFEKVEGTPLFADSKKVGPKKTGQAPK